jgi:phage-related protein
VSRVEDTGRPSDVADIYRSDRDAIIIVEVFAKKTAATPKIVIESCQKRIRQYDEIVGGHKS